jgi:GMP synthase (glutamine-hydrolysing)
MITIVDCGSQLTQNIARRVRELGVYSEIVPFNTDPDEILAKKDLEGIIISGGQFSVYDPKAPKYSRALLEAGVPVLGICYGQQSIAEMLGGEVKPAGNREYGKTSIKITGSSPLFANIPEGEMNTWMSHGDIVVKMPPGFEAVAISEGGHIAAMQNREKKIYAVQFHPEVDHTDHGRDILSGFMAMCNAKRSWDPTKAYAMTVESIKEKVRDGNAVGGMSGGVDSSVGSVLMHNAMGNRYHPIFVDNGVLRLDEAAEVMSMLNPLIPNIMHVDASQRFLERLKGVIDPDEKRKRIGNEFIYVFEEEARKIPGVRYLFQGTLYPDVIESVPIYGSSSKIKRHHNVGGLPEKMGLELIEPFRQFFKDEVREIGEYLGVPRDIVWRHPFPGPGLAVRIIGEVTPQKLEILRRADDIFIRELRQNGVYDDISQALAVLTNTQSVGVMGDEGTYQHVVALRAVTTNDFMTSDIYRFDWDLLQKITNRIINEVKGVNRVVYDTSQKPPSTIEWE